MSGLFGPVALNLLLAWGAGAAVGLERSLHGRAAGFRTHALVGLAAGSVALLAFAPQGPGGAASAALDPSRLAQGVMTGIGFLGAGVIFKEGVSVQGLTTAASIWSTAALGLMFGVGMTGPAVLSLSLVLLTLTLFRWAEGIFPWRVYAQAILRYRPEDAPREEALAVFLRAHGVILGEVSYRLTAGGALFEFQANIEVAREPVLQAFADILRERPGLVEYEINRISK